MIKYHESLLRDSPLSLLSIEKFFSSLDTKMIRKVPNETFLRITRYEDRIPILDIFYYHRKLLSLNISIVSIIYVYKGSKGSRPFHLIELSLFI